MPVPSTSIFGNKVLVYPNIMQYGMYNSSIVYSSAKSHTSRESHAFLVNSCFFAHLSFISHISFVCLLYRIVFGSNGKFFLLVATSEFKQHKNALVAGAAPRTSPAELNYSIPQTWILKIRMKRGEKGRSEKESGEIEKKEKGEKRTEEKDENIGV